MANNGGYTYFGRLIGGWMEELGLEQEDVAEAFRRRGFEGIQQQEVSNWLRTPNVPHYAPGPLIEILELNQEQEAQFNWAFVNGRVHLSDEEIVDVERRMEEYRELRRRRRKRRGTQEGQEE